jgi:hypothetical protein
VKSADYDSLGSRPQQIIEALTHLPGGALCERHGRDTVRFDTTLGDEPGDTMCEGSRLARARTGDDGDRSTVGFYSLLLFDVEPLGRWSRFSCHLEQSIDAALVSVLARQSLDDVGRFHVGWGHLGAGNGVCRQIK